MAGSSTAESGPARARRPRQSDAIYGTIITASVLASAGDELATWPLVISVLITLVVYWFADVYAELLAGQLERKRVPTFPEIRHTLVETSPMVGASFSPLLILVLASLLGAASSTAATIALVEAIAILTLFAWSACRAAGLRGVPMIAVTVIAAALGVLMIVLKNVVLVHLH